MTDTPRRISLVGLTALACLALLAAAGAALADRITSQKDLLPPPKTAGDDPPLPELNAAEKACLIKLARQALEHSARTGQR